MNRVASNLDPAEPGTPCAYCLQVDEKVKTLTYPYAIPSDAWYGMSKSYHEDATDCVAALLLYIAEVKKELEKYTKN